MRFYTEDECEKWLTGRARQKPDQEPGLLKEIVAFPRNERRVYNLAHQVATSWNFAEPVLLWITQTGIWGSSENWHVYYKLRQSYQDPRLLHEASGHYFLDYEMQDLTSFLQIVMLHGWDAYLLTEAGYVNAFISHDGFIDFYCNNESTMAEIRKAMASAQTPSA